MKHYYLVLGFFFCLSGLAVAQEKSAAVVNSQQQVTVPDVVREAFTRDHPGNSGTWTMEDENYRVEFIDKDSRLTQAIVYDSEGKIVRRDSELEKVPDPINEYYNMNFPGETLRTWSSENEKGEKYYYSNRKSEALRFDREGHYIMPENKPFTPAKSKKNSAE